MFLRSTIRAACLLPACACLLTFAAVAPAQTAPPSTPSAPPQQTQPQPSTPHGEVIFEGHAPDAVPDDEQSTAPQAGTSTTAPPAKPGVSSSNKNPKTLRRRSDGTDANAAPAGAVDDSTAPATVAPGAAASVSSSTAAADDDAQGPIVITAADHAAADRITAAQRAQVSILRTVLDVHLDTHTGAVETRAQLTVRNTGAEPLAVLPLRISGALKWESARLLPVGTAVTGTPLQQYHLADDLDHTGAATELALHLPQPLAPGAELSLDLYYGGTLTASADRLLALGAPQERALRTDWDTVTDTFTGVRGLGDVLWYPVSASPALLRDGSVPATVEHSRTADAASSFHLNLTLTYAGSAPTAAWFCGERQPLRRLGVADVAGDAPALPQSGGVVIATWDRPTLGAHTPSLFVTSEAAKAAASTTNHVVSTYTASDNAAHAVTAAADRLRPMMGEWLGASPRRPLDVLDLPVPDAAAFADGALLVIPVGSVGAPALVQPLAGAWMPDGIAAAWLREGIPAFLQAVYAERTDGRATSLNALASLSTALRAQSAPAVSSSSSASQDDTPPTAVAAPLATCVEAACTRARSAYVLEMLRSALGDDALAQAVSGWAVGVKPTQTAASQTADFERLLQQVAGKRDLAWFFHDWIDAGRGLPELSIVTVAPRRVERNAPTNLLPLETPERVGGPIGPEPVPQRDDPEWIAEHKTYAPGDRVAPAVGSWMVAVEVQNAGDAAADVPVTVRSGNLTNTLPLHVPAHGIATVRIPFEAYPKEVLVNDGSVPEVRTTQHRRSVGSLPPAAR